MPTFNYEGRDSQGAIKSGRRESGSKDDLAGSLMSEGITPVEITEASGSGDISFKLPLISLSKKVTSDELSLFVRQMQTLTKSGITISVAIRNIGNATQNLYFKEVLFNVSKKLEEGVSLSKALSAYPKVFNALMVSMIQIGQDSGDLESVFMSLSDYLELEKGTMKKLKSATRYPMFVIIAISIAVVIVNIFVIPSFASIFEKSGIEMPAITKALLAFSSFIKNYWYVCLGVMVFIYICVKKYLATKDGRYRWDRLQFKLPGVGFLLQRMTLLRFAETLNIVISAGVPVVHGLSLVSDAMLNTYAKEEIAGMKNTIQRGGSFLQAATACKLMTPMELQMFYISEETGELGSMLKDLSTYYQAEVEYDLKKMMEILEPIILVVVASLVIMLALAVYLPMWNMIQLPKK